jgi:hypothetical protein
MIYNGNKQERTDLILVLGKSHYMSSRRKLDSEIATAGIT